MPGLVPPLPTPTVLHAIVRAVTPIAARLSISGSWAPHWPQSPEEWTVAGVLLTALFTGALMVNDWRRHRHDRTLAGHRRPVKISRSNGAFVLDKPPTELGLKLARYALIHVFNRSEVRQRIAVDQRRSRVIWPLWMRDRPYACTGEIDIAANLGGNLWIGLERKSENSWPKHGINQRTGLSKRGYWLLLVATTMNGKRVRRLPVRVHLQPVLSDLAIGAVIPELPLRPKPPRYDSEAVAHREGIVSMVQGLGREPYLSPSDLQSKGEYYDLLTHLSGTDDWVQSLEKATKSNAYMALRRQAVQRSISKEVAKADSSIGDYAASAIYMNIKHPNASYAPPSDLSAIFEVQSRKRWVTSLPRTENRALSQWNKVISSRPSADHLRDQLTKTECPGCPR